MSFLYFVTYCAPILILILILNGELSSNEVLPRAS